MSDVESSVPRAEDRAEPSSPRHELLAGILDATQLVIYLKDVAGRYLFVNRQYEKLSTVPRAFVLGKCDEDLFPPETAKLFRAQDADVIARRTLIEFEETIELPGGVFSFITGKFPLIDARGQVYAVGGFCTDITSRKNRAEESLAAERERLAVTLRAVGEGIISTDTEGRVLSMNPAAEHLTGTRQLDVVGRSVEDVFKLDENTERPGQLVADAVKSGRVVNSVADVGVLSLNGSKRFLAATAAPVDDRTGHLIGAVLSLRDMTEQRRITEALFQARNLQSVGALAGGIAHDFNNLLTGILGNIGLIKQEMAASSNVIELAKETESICQQAMMLSRQLLTFAKGGTPVSRPLALGPVIESTTRLVLSGSALASVVDIVRDLWAVEGDEGQLVQVLSNLLINAKEAMPEGGTVTLRARNVESSIIPPSTTAVRCVELTLSDDGPGIPEPIIRSVFDPYFSTKERGSGLGLSIVFSVVRRHGGQVSVESTVGRGTTFTIVLPATEEIPTIAPVVRAARAPAEARAANVLLMDDEAMIRRVAGRILERAGHSVRAVSSGAGAVNAYSEALSAGKRFDVVLLDVTVPGGMGGPEAARRILEADPSARIVLCSGYSEGPVPASDVASARMSTLNKPYTDVELANAVALAIDATGA